MKKWQHIIDELDNLIYLLAAMLIYCVAKWLDIPDMSLLAGACLIKVEGKKKNGNAS